MRKTCERFEYTDRESNIAYIRGQELCKSGGGRPGLPVPNSPYGLCGRRATLNSNSNIIVQELCESRGGRPGLSVLTSLLASVDVKIY